MNLSRNNTMDTRYSISEKSDAPATDFYMYIISLLSFSTGVLSTAGVVLLIKCYKLYTKNYDLSEQVSCDIDNPRDKSELVEVNLLGYDQQINHDQPYSDQVDLYSSLGDSQDSDCPSSFIC